MIELVESLWAKARLDQPVSEKTLLFSVSVFRCRSRMYRIGKSTGRGGDDCKRKDIPWNERREILRWWASIRPWLRIILRIREEFWGFLR